VVAEGANGNLAVVADADPGLEAPNKRPPGALWGGADDGAALGEGLLVSLEWGLAQFAVDFMLVGVRDQLVQQVVGAVELTDVIGGQERDEAFLPVVVAAFDFAFGLRGGGVGEVNAVEAEGLSELGEGVGVVSVEEGVEVDVEAQRQTVGLEDAGEEIEVGQEGFAGVEAGAGVKAGGIIQDVQQSLFAGLARQPSVGAGVVLPEGAVVAGLPAFDGFRGRFVARIGRQLMRQSPAADTGAVGEEVEAAVEFAGDGTVGGRWLGREQFSGQHGDLGRPVRVVIAAGERGRPSIGTALGASPQIVGAELVEAAQAHAQFEGDGFGGQQARTSLSQEMPDQRGGDTVSKLKFFIARRVAERWIYRLGPDAGRG